MSPSFPFNKLLLLLLFPISVIAQDSISGSRNILQGQSTSLTDVVNTTYLWSTGATTQSITVSPATTTTYTVTRTTNGNAVISTITVNVTVDTSAYDSSAIAFFNACASVGYPVTSGYKIKYNKYIKYLKDHSQWSNSDSRFIFATGDEHWAERDLKNPSRTITLRNTYLGEFTTDKGFNGNSSFSILTNFNPGDGGTYNFIQNSCSYGSLMINSNSASPTVDCSASNSSGGSGISMTAYAGGVGYLNSAFSLSGAPYKKYRFTSYCWQGCNRTSSTAVNVYTDGVNTCTQSVTSTAPLNESIALLGFYKGGTTWGTGQYSLNTHAAFYSGSGSLNQTIEQNAFNYAFNYGNETNLNKRVIFEGDSRTGSFSGSTASLNSEYPKKTIQALGSGWSGLTVSEGGEKLQQITTQYTSEIQPFRDTALSKDVIAVWAGTNDFASNRTAAQVYTDLVSFCTQAHANGFKIVVVGDIARGTYTTAQQSASTTYTNTLLTDFSTNVSTNIYSGASYADYYINLIGDAAFQNAANTTYYQVDGIHLNATGYDIVAPYVVTAIQLF